MGNHADRQSNTLNMGAIALKTERATFFEDVFVGQKKTPGVGCSKGLDAGIQTVASAPPTCDQFHSLAPPDRDRKVESTQLSIDRHEGQSPQWFVKY